MKKLILFLGLVSLFSLNGKSQTKNVDIDSYDFSYAYRALPERPLNPIRFTYATRVTASGAVRMNVSVEDLNERINLQGQIRVYNPAQASMIVELIVGSLMVSSTEIYERKSETKDKQGNVTERFYYRIMVKYTFESSYKITKDQKPLANGNFYSKYNTHTYTSAEFSTRQAASEFWDNNRNALTSDFHQDLVLKSVASLNELISNRYGFPAKFNSWDVLKIMDEKKHDENANFRAAVGALKNELQAMTPDFPMDRDQVEPLIEYFENIPKRYADPNSKADQHIRYAAYFNLCKIYYYLDEPENVAQYANRITSNGYDAKDGAKLIKEANELKGMFINTGIRTRHFSPDDYFGDGR